jgi:hypothetical protein
MMTDKLLNKALQETDLGRALIAQASEQVARAQSRTSIADAIHKEEERWGARKDVLASEISKASERFESARKEFEAAQKARRIVGDRFQNEQQAHYTRIDELRNQVRSNTVCATGLNRSVK